MAGDGVSVTPEAPAFGPRRPLTVADALENVTRTRARHAILVEGWSDAAAVEALARCRGIDLGERGVLVLPIGGITNLAAFLLALRAPALGLGLSGLYDAGEERVALSALARAGSGPGLARADAERAGFFACDRDLEDELIRAVGPEAVARLLAAQDEFASFVRFQRQPEHRERDAHAQLRRFMGTRAGRKIRYGTLLVEALPPERVPAALQHVLTHALQDSGARQGAPKP